MTINTSTLKKWSFSSRTMQAGIPQQKAYLPVRKLTSKSKSANIKEKWYNFTSESRYNMTLLNICMYNQSNTLTIETPETF